MEHGYTKESFQTLFSADCPVDAQVGRMARLKEAPDPLPIHLSFPRISALPYRTEISLATSFHQSSS
jgi:hypothetical protein